MTILKICAYCKRRRATEECYNKPACIECYCRQYFISVAKKKDFT